MSVGMESMQKAMERQGQSSSISKREPKEEKDGTQEPASPRVAAQVTSILLSVRVTDWNRRSALSSSPFSILNSTLANV